MSFIFRSTMNTRQILPDSLKFIRSDIPNTGFAEEYIVDDYMKLKDNLTDMLNAYSLQNPEIDVNIITPNEKYIKDFLRQYDDK